MPKTDLLERTKKFSLNLIRVIQEIPRSRESDVFARQVLRSGTSVGANYREAFRSRSRSEFIAKLGICCSEAEETMYWLELIEEAALASPSMTRPLRREINELISIFVTSLNTAKGANK